jgi:hypothetical protein
MATVTTTNSLESRVAELERAVAELKQQYPPPGERGLDAIVGIFRDTPEFEEVIRLMREAREAEKKQLEEAP